MGIKTWIPYLLLLSLAFSVGLIGTLAATRVIAAPTPKSTDQGRERPAQAPSPGSPVNLISSQDTVGMLTIPKGGSTPKAAVVRHTAADRGFGFRPPCATAQALMWGLQLASPWVDWPSEQPPELQVLAAIPSTQNVGGPPWKSGFGTRCALWCCRPPHPQRANFPFCQRSKKRRRPRSKEHGANRRLGIRARLAPS